MSTVRNAKTGLYKGFSTYNRKRKFALTDYELVKQDLFNHLNIRKGEKLMNPNFGTIIWGMLFEPFTPELKNMIIEDIRRIVSYEPRLGLNQLIVQEYYNGIQIDITVTYKTENFVDTIKMNFDKNSATNAMGK